jgi:hypothetical protein
MKSTGMYESVYSYPKFSNKPHILMHHIVVVLLKCLLFPFYFSVAKNIHCKKNCFYVGDQRHGSHSFLQEMGKPTQSVGLQVHHYGLFLKLVRAGVHKFPKVWKSPQNYGHQNDDIKQVP